MNVTLEFTVLEKTWEFLIIVCGVIARHRHRRQYIFKRYNADIDN